MHGTLLDTFFRLLLWRGKLFLKSWKKVQQDHTITRGRFEIIMTCSITNFFFLIFFGKSWRGSGKERKDVAVFYLPIFFVRNHNCFLSKKREKNPANLKAFLRYVDSNSNFHVREKIWESRYAGSEEEVGNKNSRFVEFDVCHLKISSDK